MKRTFASALLVLLTCSMHAQDIVKEGIFKYTIITQGLNNAGKETKRMEQCTLQFTGTAFKRVFSRGAGLLSTTLSTCGATHSSFFATNGEKYYTYPADVYASDFFEMGLYNKKNGETIFYNDTATINGFFCKKAIVLSHINNNTDSVEVWYTPSHVIRTTCFDYFFKDIKGLPVYFKFIQRSMMTMAKVDHPLTVEYSLNLWSAILPAAIDSIDRRNDYVEVGESERMQKFMEVYSRRGSKPLTAPKGIPTTREIVNGNGTTIKITTYNAFAVGQQMENFKGADLQGAAKGLESYGDHAVVFNFWFTQCGPCINEMPLLNKVMAANKGRKVSFVSITYNKKEEVAAFLKTHAFDFEKIAGAQDIIESYGISSYPATIIVDSKHMVRYSRVGAFENDAQLQQEIDAVLEKETAK